MLNGGVGGVCPALSNSPGDSALAFGPRGGHEGLPPPPPQQGGGCWQHRPDLGAKVGSGAGCRSPPPLPEYPPPQKPLPSNQPTFNMTMAMTIPSRPGQAGEDIKHPPHPPPPNGVLACSLRRQLAARWGSRAGHECPPGHAHLPALPRLRRVWGLLLALPREHGQRARRGGSACGHPPLPRGGEDPQPPR